MFKKLLLTLPVIAISIFAFQTANADYRELNQQSAYDRGTIIRECDNCVSERQRIEPEEDLNIRKIRKYCIREHCYIIYEICDNSGHCKKKIKREKYCEYCKNWNNWNRYVYRGTHYGGYYNRYWSF